MVVSNSISAPSLRQRKQLAAMKRVQRVAVERFLADGFDRVTVEQIAAAAEVSAMSIYRWFGTKEGLVIWDEFDPPILGEIERRLSHEPALAAVRQGFEALLEDVYDRERGLALDRARLIHREPALLAAAQRNSRGLRDALADLFTGRGEVPQFEAEVAAAVAVALLEVAVDAWQRHAGRRALAELIGEAFDALEGAA